MAAGRVLASSQWLLQVFGLEGASRSLGLPDMVYDFDGQHALVADTTCTAQRVISLSVLGDEPPLLPSDRPRVQCVSYGRRRSWGKQDPLVTDPVDERLDR